MSSLHAADCANERAQQNKPPTPGQMKEFWAQVQSGRITNVRMQAFLRLDIRTEWQDFYARVLGMEVDLSEVRIPKHVPGFDRVIIIAKGLLISQALAACRFPHWCYLDNPDSFITKNERSSTDAAYAIRVRDRVEADEELKNLSAEDISAEQRGIATETAFERVIHELKYHHETGDHLDKENVTLCAGSRDSDGYVPYARWYGDKFRLPCFRPQYADSHLRAREVVTL